MLKQNPVTLTLSNDVKNFVYGFINIGPTCLNAVICISNSYAEIKPPFPEGLLNDLQAAVEQPPLLDH